MVVIAEIVDKMSLEAWLKEQPKEVSTWLAHRVAMRLLPIWWDLVLRRRLGRRPELTALSVLRGNLISGVALPLPASAIVHAAADAAYALATNAATPNNTTGAADAAYTATYNAVAHVPGAAATTNDARGFAFFARDDAANADAAKYAAFENYGDVNDAPATDFIWHLFRLDCIAISSGVNLDRLPLWGRGKNPLAEVWAKIKERLLVASSSRSDETTREAVGVDWSFWIKWYDDALEGNPPNWDMLERIALIDPKEWDKGAARVNFLIGEIEKEFAPDVVPYADVITYDQQYHSEPRSELPAQTLEDARARIEDVIEGLHKMGNQYPELGEEADLLARMLERYPDQAIRLFEVCQKVVVHVGNHLAAGVVPRDDNRVGDAIIDLQNTADDIYNFDPEVKQVSDARDARRFERLNDAQREVVAQISEAVAQNSDADLADEMREDANEVVAGDDPEGETKPARYRLGSRLTRIWALGGEGLKNVYKALGLVGTVGGGGTALWALIKFLIGF